MKRSAIVHYPCGNTNPYNRLLAEGLRQAGVAVEMRPVAHHTNPARSLRWAWGARLVHFHWIQGLYIGRSRWRFVARAGVFLLVLAGLRLRGTRLVLTVHNLVPHEHRYRLLHRLVNIGVGRLVQRLVVHSEPAAEAVADEYLARRKIRVIEHVDYGEPATAVGQAEARRALKLPLDRRLLLFFGNIRPYKGVDHLIDAAPRLAALGCDIVVAGRPYTGAFAAELEAATAGAPNVHLRFGELSDARLSEYLVAADAIAFPYKAGLSSGAAHLALSHQKPFLCSRSLAFEHFIRMDIALPCTPSEPEDLCRAAALALALDAGQWRETVTAYRRKCHPETIGTRLGQIYAELLTDALYSTAPLNRGPSGASR